MSVVLVTDSGCDLAREETQRVGIDVIPMYVIMDGVKYRDGVDLDLKAFRDRLRSTEKLPQTEPPSTADFSAAFKRHIDAGNDVVYVSISSQISQANANAKAAAREFGTKVQIVDSRGASGMQTLLCLRGTELAKAGNTAEEVAKLIDPAHLKNAVYFAVPAMTHLGRSGRLPKAIVSLGGLLNVSLVMRMNDMGAIGPAGQSRSFEKTCEIMVDAVLRAIDRSSNARVVISHVQDPDTAEKLRQQFETKLGHPLRFELVNESTAVIATHLGPGAVGIFAIVP